MLLVYNNPLQHTHNIFIYYYIIFMTNSYVPYLSVYFLGEVFYSQNSVLQLKLAWSWQKNFVIRYKLVN